MLLRRVIEHVKEQNWTAIGLDFMIVVVGVFIGLQVSNWNDTRGDRQRERQILAEISADLEADIDQYTSSIQASLSKIAVIEHILLHSAHESTVDLVDHMSILGNTYDDYKDTSTQLKELSFEQRVSAASLQFWSIAISVSNAQPSSTAFDSLVSSGELKVLRSDDLVRQLQEYRTMTAALEKAQEATFRPARDRAIDTGHTYGLSIFEGAEPQHLIDLVSQHKDLFATLQTQRGWATGHFIMLSRAQDLADGLLTQIESEMNTSRL